jgi:hypothetical protein
MVSSIFFFLDHNAAEHERSLMGGTSNCSSSAHLRADLDWADKQIVDVHECAEPFRLALLLSSGAIVGAVWVAWAAQSWRSR